MRILYGVVGEGMGHAIRSRVVMEHLVASGHEVEIIASGRAADFLEKRFSGVKRIHGLHIVTKENQVRRGQTVLSNLIRGTAALPRTIAAYFDLIEAFEPDAVISDFESWAYVYAKAHRLPILSVDNIQVINRCKHPPEVLKAQRTDFEIARTVIRGKLPFCDHYIVTTFFKTLGCKEHTTICRPILRPEILAASPAPGNHLLVYQTAEGYRTLADRLQQTGFECRIYGMKRQLSEDQVEGNLRYRPFDEKSFIEDLASCRAVIAGGGFTTLSEAVYLRKPVFSVPISGQFEQVLNARYIEREGFGLYAARADDAARLKMFVDHLPDYARRLSGYHQDGNREALQAVDEQLDRIEAGVY